MRLILSIVLLATVLPVFSQSWKKFQKEADISFSEGKYYEAGTYYYRAWELKKQYNDNLYRAGEAYYYARAYKEAAQAYKPLKNQNARYPLIGLKYARCLKQNAQYEEAVDEFVHFLNNYSGGQLDILQAIVETEIHGCEFGKLIMEDHSYSIIPFELLPRGSVNSSEDAYSPVPIDESSFAYLAQDNALSAFLAGGNTSGKWKGNNATANWPEADDNNFISSASLSPDKQRLYFTQCISITDKYGLQDQECAIFVSQKKGYNWSAPEKLPHTINAEGSTATHPFVTEIDGKEMLFFVSNREGGIGEKDIYATVRYLNDDIMQFSPPVNLGTEVNTAGDEVTPYYDTNEGALFFSSNGHISMGGFDIYKSVGQLDNWTRPDNLGLPFNSSNDDLHFIKTEYGESGFLVSNRLFHLQRTDTRDYDIFHFELTHQQTIAISGDLMDFASEQHLEDVNVELFEIDNKEELLIPIRSETFSTAFYMDGLRHGKLYRIKASKPGYSTISHDFYTLNMDHDEDEIRHDLILERIDVIIEEEDVVLAQRKVPGIDIKSYTDNEEGSYFKVQIAAIKKFNADEQKYNSVRDLGNLHTEYYAEKNLTRVLLGNYATAEQALQAVKELKSSNFFSKAFVVEYFDNERIRVVKK